MDWDRKNILESAVYSDDPSSDPVDEGIDKGSASMSTLTRTPPTSPSSSIPPIIPAQPKRHQLTSDNSHSNSQILSSSPLPRSTPSSSSISISFPSSSSSSFPTSLNSSGSSILCLPHPGAVVPNGIPVTSEGIPDIRTSEALDWVQSIAKTCVSHCLHYIPSWLPKTLDGRLDTTSPLVHAFLYACPKSFFSDRFYRTFYYESKINKVNSPFPRFVHDVRTHPVTIPEPTLLNETQVFRTLMLEDRQTRAVNNFRIPEFVTQISWLDLFVVDSADGGRSALGRGSFGTVVKMQWEGQTVAVKKLEDFCPRRDMGTFVKELKIMSLLGQHPNFVKSLGYTLYPASLVMELVELGSLDDVLYNRENDLLEAQITCGAFKKKIILGIVDGLRQLHATGVIHGDLKPDNVLVDDSFNPKIADFGLAIIGKKPKDNGSTDTSSNSSSSSSCCSCQVESSISDTSLSEISVSRLRRHRKVEPFYGGTQAYAAPELSIPGTRQNFKSDIYSFGILLNEVIQEERPYHGISLPFQPLGIVDFAAKGHRPFVDPKTPPHLIDAIQSSWDANQEVRPDFEHLLTSLLRLDFPDSFLFEI